MNMNYAIITHLTCFMLYHFFVDKILCIDIGKTWKISRNLIYNTNWTPPLASDAIFSLCCMRQFFFCCSRKKWQIDFMYILLAWIYCEISSEAHINYIFKSRRYIILEFLSRTSSPSHPSRIVIVINKLWMIREKKYIYD